MRTIRLNKSLRLIGSDIHAWRLRRLIGPSDDRLWISFRNFPSLKAARAKLGKFKILAVSVTSEERETTSVKGFMPTSTRGIDGLMKSANGWKDRHHYDCPHANWTWKPERVA